MKIEYIIKRIEFEILKRINKFSFKKKYYCNICKVHTFTRLPKGKKLKTSNKFQIIGGGYRKKSFCINCYSYDRERYVFFIIEKYTDILIGNKKVLHIAPEESIRELMEKCNTNSNYLTGDIIQRDYTYKVDITNMQFKKSTFDYIICNHVLEHIANERDAINEIKRVLKKDGIAILSVPINIKSKKTTENASIITQKDRIKNYGQKDHVRLYGTDFKKRLESYGLNVEEHVVKNELSIKRIKELSLIPEDRIYICKKAI